MKLILCEYETGTPGMPHINFDGVKLTFTDQLDYYPGITEDEFVPLSFEINAQDALLGKFGNITIDVDGEKAVLFKQGVPYGFLKQTFVTKETIQEWRKTGVIDCVVLVPFVGCSVGDISVYANIPKGCERVVNGIQYEESASVPSKLYLQDMPNVVLTNLGRQGDVISIGVEFVDKAGGRIDAAQTVYLSSTAGVLSHARVALVDGYSTVSLDVSSLSQGMSLKVKAGYKWFSGVSEMEITA